MGNKERFTTNSLLRKIRHSCTFLKRELYSKNKMCDQQQHLIDLCCRRLNHSAESGIDNFQLHCPEGIAGEQEDADADANSDYQANTVICVDNSGTANTSEIAIEEQTNCLEEACLDLKCAPSATRSVERILEAASAATVAATNGAPGVGSSPHAEQVSDTPRSAGKIHSTVPIAILQQHAGLRLVLNFLRFLETSRYN
jgi:hypothetical protein